MVESEYMQLSYEEAQRYEYNEIVNKNYASAYIKKLVKPEVFLEDKFENECNSETRFIKDFERW